MSEGRSLCRRRRDKTVLLAREFFVTSSSLKCLEAMLALTHPAKGTSLGHA